MRYRAAVRSPAVSQACYAKRACKPPRVVKLQVRAAEGRPFPAKVILTSAHTRYGELASACPTAAPNESLKLSEVDVTDALI